jgi:hypothetical protein
MAILSIDNLLENNLEFYKRKKEKATPPIEPLWQEIRYLMSVINALYENVKWSCCCYLEVLNTKKGATLIALYPFKN